jgi:SAM-dependent methyltransferase
MPPMTAPADAPQRGAGPQCAWCGWPARIATGRLAVCDACGSATTFPAPDAAELDAAYHGWYRPESGRFTAGGDLLLARSRATLATRLDRRAPDGPVLDVGSGDGALLDAFRRRGRDVVGLERSSTRPDVRALEVQEFRERVGEWGAVVFWHSLEHLRHPAAALSAAHELLRPEGLVSIAVPNRASWQARMFGERWFGLDVPRHLVHLQAPALVAGLRGQGYEVEHVSYWRGGQIVFGWLHGLVGLLPGHPDLYAAIRRPEARSAQLTPGRRMEALIGAAALSPVAAAAALAEIASRAGGTVYVEARRG